MSKRSVGNDPPTIGFDAFMRRGDIDALLNTNAGRGVVRVALVRVLAEVVEDYFRINAEEVIHAAARETIERAVAKHVRDGWLGSSGKSSVELVVEKLVRAEAERQLRESMSVSVSINVVHRRSD